MRLRTLILVGIVCVASACSEKPFGADQPQENGTISVQIEPEIYVNNATKAVSAGPDVNEFKVEIYKYVDQGLLRLYRDTYENTVGKQISLNAADYMVHARHGDSLGVGFNAIYYAAQANLTVHPQTNEVVHLEAKMGNAKVAVEYGDDLNYDWPEYYAKVKCTTKGGRKRSLQFSQTETRAGYMPAGQFVLELYVKVGEDWMYYHTDEMAVLPNDFITFKVDTEKADGNLTLSARVDNGVEVVEKNIEVSSSWLSKDAPVVNTLDANGNDFTNQTYSLIEAANSKLSGLKANIVAPGLINHCYLEVTSEYLRANGVPEVVDLAQKVDPEVEAALKAVGLRWLNAMSGQRLGYVDFSGVANWIEQQVCDPSNLFSAEFSLRVEDQRQAMGEAQTAPVTFTQGKPEFDFYEIPAYDCWAKRIDNVTTFLTSGNPDALTLECKKSTEGEDAWTRVLPGEGSESNARVYSVKGLEPSTTYNFRARYNHNPLTEITRTATTEAAGQVGNNGFEQHTYESFAFQYKAGVIFGSTVTEYRTWYQPYKSGETDPWWAVNSTATLDKSVTTQYLHYKCFPTVCMTNQEVYAGSRSIVVASIAVSDAASDWDLAGSSGDAVSGELYIGKADNSDEHKNTHVSDGHSFTSRPTSMSFYCKFDCHDSPFLAEIKLYNGSTEIASGSIISEQASISSWTKVDVPLTYSHTDRKADKIYIAFVSSSTNSTGFRTTKLNILNTSGSNITTDNIHAGNIIWLDEVILNYE